MGTFQNIQREDAQHSNTIIQPALEIGKEDDEYEKEADSVADKVMKMSDDDEEKVQMKSDDDEEKVQMKSDDDEEKVQMKSDEEEEKVQMKSDEDEEMPAIQEKTDRSKGDIVASQQVEQGINSTKGNGHSLSLELQQEMGNKMGDDLSDVKVHTDEKAAEMNQEIGAKAFTHGNDIYFNNGQYNPSTSKGKHLLAHELTHTIQQGKSIRKSSDEIKNIPEKTKSILDDLYEREMMTLPFVMNAGLLNWIANFTFPLDPVNQSLGDRVIEAITKKMGDWAISKLISLIPNKPLQEALKIGYDVTKTVVSSASSEKKDYSNLRKFFNSLAQTYNSQHTIGDSNFDSYKEATIDFEVNMKLMKTEDQLDIYNTVSKQKADYDIWHDDFVASASLNLYFSSLYMNASAITPPDSEKYTTNGATSSFLVIDYNVDASAGVIGEKDGKYEFFANPTSRTYVESKGYKMIESGDILSVFDKMDYPTKLHIYYSLYRAGKIGKPTATLYAPLAKNLKETMYAFSVDTALDLDKLAVRRRLMLNNYTINQEIDSDGKLSGVWGGWTRYNYDAFYWKIMYSYEKIPSVEKDNMYAVNS